MKKILLLLLLPFLNTSLLMATTSIKLSYDELKLIIMVIGLKKKISQNSC